VATRRLIHVCARCLDDGQARGKRRSRGGFVGKHNERGSQTMAEHRPGVVGKHPVDFDRGIPAMRMQKLERVFTPWQRTRDNLRRIGSIRVCVHSHLSCSCLRCWSAAIFEAVLSECATSTIGENAGLAQFARMTASHPHVVQIDSGRNQPDVLPRCSVERRYVPRKA
jgi:hypothetical protein